MTIIKRSIGIIDDSDVNNLGCLKDIIKFVEYEADKAHWETSCLLSSISQKLKLRQNELDKIIERIKK